MTSRIVPHDDIYKRYETHHTKTLTLYVTRQNQEFVISHDITLADIKLIRSSVELVGEPGYAVNSQVGKGFSPAAGYDSAGAAKDTRSPSYLSSVNQLWDPSVRTSPTVVYGIAGTNHVQHDVDINHGWASVHIEGMTQPRSFMTDDRQSNNNLDLVVPTDSGLMAARIASHAGMANPIVLENIQLQPRLRVRMSFLGSGSQASRTARFVEDYADTNSSLRSSVTGKVLYYDGAGPNPGCQIPPNMVNCVLLQFEVTPRSTV